MDARAITDLRAVILPISVDYADVQARLPQHHGDPFDRLLISQSLTENISIVSSDAILRQLRRDSPLVISSRPLPRGYALC